MLGLVDVNNFYASCERAFNPALENRAVVVLSNNDGCVIARSNEAKVLGIKMGTPFFQLTELRRQHDIAVFSSNYTLYGDMSARAMSILGRFVEEVEVYSIDEAFLNLTGYEGVYPDVKVLAHHIRQTLLDWTRLPVSIGIAPTKTLTKVANYFAKRVADYRGVYTLTNPDLIEQTLTDFPVEELWGVGHQYSTLLKRNGIRTAAQFAHLPDDWINDRLTVNGLRTAYELRSTPCKMLEVDNRPKKAICTAPSFGREVYDLDTLRVALTTHISRCAQKLRAQASLARSVTVFIHTNRYRQSPNGQKAKAYYNSLTVELPHASSSTSELLSYAEEALRAIFQFGYAYQKVGVMLSNFVPAHFEQTALFTNAPDERLKTVSQVMDALNRRYGRDRIRLAGAGYDTSWAHKRQWMSPRYTTHWNEIMTVS